MLLSRTCFGNSRLSLKLWLEEDSPCPVSHISSLLWGTDEGGGNIIPVEATALTTAKATSGVITVYRFRLN